MWFDYLIFITEAFFGIALDLILGMTAKITLYFKGGEGEMSMSDSPKERNIVTGIGYVG